MIDGNRGLQVHGEGSAECIAQLHCACAGQQLCVHTIPSVAPASVSGPLDCINGCGKVLTGWQLSYG